jgi:hypothetical protein
MPAAPFLKRPLQGIRVVLFCNNGHIFHSIENYLRTLNARLAHAGTDMTGAVPVLTALFYV